MSGFRRGTQRVVALDRMGAREAVCNMLDELLAEGDDVAIEVAASLPARDPFGVVDHNCRSPGGHVFIADDSIIVCRHCGGIAWA
jgi:hypothetical protein